MLNSEIENKSKIDIKNFFKKEKLSGIDFFNKNKSILFLLKETNFKSLFIEKLMLFNATFWLIPIFWLELMNLLTGGVISLRELLSETHNSIFFICFSVQCFFLSFGVIAEKIGYFSKEKMKMRLASLMASAISIGSVPILWLLTKLCLGVI